MYLCDNSPSFNSNCFWLTPPFLIITNSDSVILTTVLSIPKEQLPPSKIKTSLSLWKSLNTCYAYVGETWPNLFADGAAIGNFDSYKSSKATGWFGTLIPTYPVFAVISIGILSRFALTTKVRGPGQNIFPSSEKVSIIF